MTDMKSDSYTPAIPLDELLALARTYCPPGLGKGDDLSSSDDAHRVVNQVICPCIRGDACVCDAIADEFLRLAKEFHRQRNNYNPQGHRTWISRWENEGGTTLESESTDRH
jgi:hypothetical protein